MTAYDGFLYPIWSGLNYKDKSIPAADALKSAIQSVRFIWRDDSRKSKEALARLITGSECISLLYALESALVEIAPPLQPPMG